MSKFIVLLLLCAAAIGVRMPDLFEGCVRDTSDQAWPGGCTLVSDALGNQSFVKYAEQVLRTPDLQPRTGYLNGLLGMTRVAFQHSEDELDGMIVRAEFATARSACIRHGDYPNAVCPPAVSKPNGVCQALYSSMYDGSILLQLAWCKPLQ
ncbi:uncharacterized protein LOC119458241 isoform X1 [Dermacentor silvarum]|uniref:uncharacterized protein LOC119458241 isoform X1 n=1 Tax=Dermacentor silvarum TaxID=543639 RepID=UPI0021009D4A|nr:uncharacterized protein LOC119458241 isoform X1 [Dermacentor silvarum]